MSAPSTSGLSVELLLRVIDVKYGCFTLLYFIVQPHTAPHETSSAYPIETKAIETKQESKKEYKDLKNH